MMLFRLPVLFLAVAAPAPALAQHDGDAAGPRPAYDEAVHRVPVEENVSYGYAQVLRADEVSDVVVTRVPAERCEPVSPSAAATTGDTVVGAIVGAAVGQPNGQGRGRGGATVAGPAAGVVVGHNLVPGQSAADARGCRLVEVERRERRVVGYDVEYMYKGEKYMSRLPYDPGNRLRIRVSVTPDAVRPDPR